MAKGVFLHRADSIYDDQPERQYQFPDIYLGRASQCIGDWIVYLEPSKAGKRGYHAMARLEKIVPDPTKAKHYLALIEPGSYLEFESYVPFSGVEGYPENSVLNEHGRVSGRAQAAVRTIPEADFNRIIDRGFEDEAEILPRLPEAEPFRHQWLQEERTPYRFEVERDRISQLTNRPKRDRIFRAKVLAAYDSRCALTGLKFINGGGRAEVEAAHIVPVESNGPDRVANGLALCGTVHWMFDRGLISLTDDLDILVSRQVNDAERITGMLNSSGKANLPVPNELKPHPRFLQWHREHCYKQ